MEGSDVAAASDTGLARGKESSPSHSREFRGAAWTRIALEALMAVNAVAFLAASVIHFGVRIPLGFTTLADATILPAGIAEGAIGVAFVGAAVAVIGRQDWAWNGMLGAHLFGVLGVLVGLGVSLSVSADSSPANLVFHEAILPALVIGLILLLTRSGRTALGRPTNRKGGSP
jgi:hypothetical protein